MGEVPGNGGGKEAVVLRRFGAKLQTLKEVVLAMPSDDVSAIKMTGAYQVLVQRGGCAFLELVRSEIGRTEDARLRQVLELLVSDIEHATDPTSSSFQVRQKALADFLMRLVLGEGEK
ncbi:MAG: hypothetical protein UV80_C0007G0041 [Candidatus Peregrinibacteria bacterium GW2011_GWF2_43_17]|nr:MAG: hypothetical protein UV80_C0007G0041 [Candidatus Peregrinibacteria bacterium GW2011_GWF2_43_17]KKT18684.1 MAG: hypothetical protein UW03_C0034G0013 [Candidatus Peregrinibacteria bacterium GW2011_GWA2_43_8]HAU39583.1 hypothetical protein [Candidatus Peregrinibacteria bacterium]